MATTYENFSVRSVWEESNKAAENAGGGGISSPRFVQLCKNLGICEPGGSVEVELAQAAHQKHRTGGERRLQFAGLCDALLDMILVAKAFHAGLADSEDPELQSTSEAQVARFDAMMENIKVEHAAATKASNNTKVFVPTYKNWMSNKDPAPQQRLPEISDVRPGKGAPRVQPPARYQAGHSDDMSPPAYAGKKGLASQHRSANDAADSSPGGKVLKRMVNRLAEMEDARYEASGGPAHQHAVSNEEIARKLQYMEMRLVKAEGQLNQRQARILEVEARCREADERFLLQESTVSKLQEQLEELELFKLESESNFSIMEKKLERAYQANDKLEASLLATVKVMEKRVMKIEISSVPQDVRSKGSDSSKQTDKLLEKTTIATTEAVEAKLVANKARDSAAKLDKALAMLATKIELQNNGEGSLLHQRIQELEASLVQTQQAHMDGVTKMKAALEGLGVQVELSDFNLEHQQEDNLSGSEDPPAAAAGEDGIEGANDLDLSGAADVADDLEDGTDVLGDIAAALADDTDVEGAADIAAALADDTDAVGAVDIAAALADDDEPEMALEAATTIRATSRSAVADAAGSAPAGSAEADPSSTADAEAFPQAKTPEPGSASDNASGANPTVNQEAEPPV